MSYTHLLWAYNIPDSVLGTWHGTMNKAELTDDWEKEIQTQLMIIQDDWL